MNKITVLGRLTRDVEMYETPSGVEYCRFRLASRSRSKDKDGNNQTDFFLCTAWREKATILSEHTKRGSLLMVMGAMQSRQYDDNGTKRIIWEVTVDDFEFASSGKENGSDDDSNEETPAKPSAPAKKKSGKASPYDGLTAVIDEELPF